MLCLITIIRVSIMTKTDVGAYEKIILAVTVTQTEVDVNTVLTVIPESTVTLKRGSYNDNFAATVTQTNVGSYK